MKTLFSAGAGTATVKATIAALLLGCLSSGAQTNASKYGYVTNTDLLTPFTLTNAYRHVVTNAVLYKLMPNEIIYKTADGEMGTVRFDSLSKDLREKFGFNQADAAEADKADQRRKLQYQQQLQRQQILSKQQTQQAAVLQQATRIVGVVIQKTKAGLLVDWDQGVLLTDEIPVGTETSAHRYQIILLKDDPAEAGAAADDRVRAVAFPIGTYSYTTVNKSEKTVHAYTCSTNVAFEFYYGKH